MNEIQPRSTARRVATGAELGVRGDPIGRALRNESGAVAIIVALFMVVLMGLAALAVDGGDLYAQQRDLQTAADSGALAGALALARGDAWETEASDYVDKNRTANPNLAGATPAGVTLTQQIDGPAVLGSDGVLRDGVRVTLREDGVPLFFAPFLNAIWSG